MNKKRIIFLGMSLLGLFICSQTSFVSRALVDIGDGGDGQIRVELPMDRSTGANTLSSYDGPVGNGRRVLENGHTNICLILDGRERRSGVTVSIKFTDDVPFTSEVNHNHTLPEVSCNLFGIHVERNGYDGNSGNFCPTTVQNHRLNNSAQQLAQISAEQNISNEYYIYSERSELVIHRGEEVRADETYRKGVTLTVNVGQPPAVAPPPDIYNGLIQPDHIPFVMDRLARLAHRLTGSGSSNPNVVPGKSADENGRHQDQILYAAIDREKAGKGMDKNNHLFYRRFSEMIVAIRTLIGDGNLAQRQKGFSCAVQCYRTFGNSPKVVKTDGSIKILPTIGLEEMNDFSTGRDANVDVSIPLLEGRAQTQDTVGNLEWELNLKCGKCWIAHSGIVVSERSDLERVTPFKEAIAQQSVDDNISGSDVSQILKPATIDILRALYIQFPTKARLKIQEGEVCEVKVADLEKISQWDRMMNLLYCRSVGNWLQPQPKPAAAAPAKPRRS